MTELKLAIKAITIAMEQEPLIYEDEPFFTVIHYALETALAALREKAARDKGCVWCKEDDKVFHNGQHFHFFCSYCGKRLEVEHELSSL